MTIHFKMEKQNVTTTNQHQQLPPEPIIQPSEQEFQNSKTYIQSQGQNTVTVKDGRLLVRGPEAEAATRLASAQAKLANLVEKQDLRKTTQDPPPPTALKSPMLRAYNLFSADVRPIIKEENPGANFNDILRIIGQRWRQLSDEDKAVYIERAKKYNAEKEELQKKKEKKKQLQTEEEMNKAKQQAENAAPKPPPPTALPNPYTKGMVTTYNPFSADVRRIIMEKNPDVTISQISLISGEQWRQLSDIDKARYTKKYKEARKEQLAMEMKKQEARNAAPKPPSLTSLPNPYTKGMVTTCNPFSTDVRRIIMEKNPDVTIAQISLISGEQWRQLSDIDKARYTKKYKEARKEQLAMEMKQQEVRIAGPKPPPATTHPNTDQKRVTTYNPFSADVIMEKNPDIKISKISPSSFSGEQWRQLSNIDKARYYKEYMEARKEKKKEKKKQQAQIAAPPPPVITARPNPDHKKPVTAYNLFSADVRRITIEKNSGAKIGDISRIAGELWRNMSDEDKAIYAERANKNSVDREEQWNEEKWQAGESLENHELLPKSKRVHHSEVKKFPSLAYVIRGVESFISAYHFQYPKTW